MATSLNNPTPGTINALLGKLSDADPDFRFMSLTDLNTILTKQKPDFLQHDYNTASRIVDAVIKALDDQNGEVQNLAIKCIGPLVSRIPTTVVAPTLEKLTMIKMKNSPDNSLPSLALRSAISALPKPVRGIAPTREVVDTYNIISRVLIPRILGFSTTSNASRPMAGEPQGLLDEKSEVTSEAVDVLIEAVRCFGPLLQPLEVEKLQDVVVHVLERDGTSSPVKKRAVVALAILGPYLSPEVLNGLINKINTALQRPKLHPVMLRLYINIMGSLARSIPHEFGEHLPTLLPFILKTLGQDQLQVQLEAVSEGNDQASVEFNEVREAALVALDAFLASCGTQMRSFTEDVIACCLRYLKYDPNYSMDEDENDDGDDEEYEDDDEFGDDAGFDDDDDASWKVRRCAAKTLHTLISTRSSDLLDKGTLYSEVALPLVKRFDEREESVRLEVIGTMALLVRKTGEGVIRSLSADEQDLLQSLPESRKRRRQSSGGVTMTSKAPYLGATGLTSPAREEVPSTGPRADLSNMTPSIVKTATKLLKGKQIPTKQAIINLLDDLISVQHGGLSEYFDVIMQPIIEATKVSVGATGSTSTTLSGGAASATATTLRVAVLAFISDIAKTHSSNLFQQYLSKIVAGVVAAVQDRFYKISSEAIRTAEELVKAITPPRARLTSKANKPELHKLYDIIIDRTAANDADVEVRQKAIQALGTLLSRTSTHDGLTLLPADKRQAGLALLLDRLRNETTRLYAVRAIDNVAAHSSTVGSLDPAWIQPVVLELCGQLRKSHRALRGASVQALKHLITSPASKGNLSADTISGVVMAIQPVIAANDSHLLGPALLVLAHLQQDIPQLISSPNLIPGLCELLKKNIAGSALDSLIAFVISVGQAGVGQPLMLGVLNVGVAGDPAVVGKVAGTLFVASNGSSGVDINSFINELRASSKAQDTARQSLALAILGEIGLRLGAQSPITPEIFLNEFNEEPDKVSISAAVALGRAGAGNVSVFLPMILSEITEGGSQMDENAGPKQRSKQYLLLQSIREILHQVVVSSTDIGAYESTIWELLFAASQTEDNKAICAECIGRLVIIDPKTYIPKLQALFKNPSTEFRGVAVQAIRYTLPDSDESFDALLRDVLFEMLLTVLQDEDMVIRRLAMTTLNSAAHNKPDLILPHLGQLVPYVMTESVIKPELIHEIQMGPFKHQVDEGLEVRKSAYETLYALMETAFSRISSLEFYDRVIAGLRDENDIRSLCNLMLSKLIVIDPDETTRRLDTIAECYRKILSTKLKEGSVKQEVEKQEEANKSVLRVTLLLVDKTKTTLPGANVVGASNQAQQPVSNPVWQQYWEWVNKDFERQVKSLREESKDLV
ncbi:armadillo-type protein [Pseudomassariella vexata]|uniref:Armadillo-type protein n=1 Tax=Pseudomassariella vexata TaxID=1141098 RepID=A0A1Y2EIY1_9PEZI|nr:armadillo-type protein [Pseudomassariella vexata]ORY71523.1 armadillo-type protein [Pseudomassariella vexata]